MHKFDFGCKLKLSLYFDLLKDDGERDDEVTDTDKLMMKVRRRKSVTWKGMENCIKKRAKHRLYNIPKYYKS